MNRNTIKLGLVCLLPLVGVLAGVTAAFPIAALADAQHDRQVIATTEQAAKRYSICLPGDQNLIPDWAKEPRIPMFTLDEAYR